MICRRSLLYPYAEIESSLDLCSVGLLWLNLAEARRSRLALLLAGIILFGGSIVQGTIGFALGMIAVPLLVEAGYSLSQAVALTTLAIGIQVAFGVWQLREHIPWGDVKLAALLRYLTVPIGVWLLLHIENMDADAVKRLVGCGRAARRDFAPAGAWTESARFASADFCSRLCSERHSCRDWSPWAVRHWCYG